MRVIIGVGEDGVGEMERLVNAFRGRLVCLLLYFRYRSVSLKLRDTRVCEPHIRARLGTTAHLRG